MDSIYMDFQIYGFHIYTRFVFLFLTYFTLTDSRSIHITTNYLILLLFKAE